MSIKESKESTFSDLNDDLILGSSLVLIALSYIVQSQPETDLIFMSGVGLYAFYDLYRHKSDGKTPWNLFRSTVLFFSVAGFTLAAFSMFTLLQWVYIALLPLFVIYLAKDVVGVFR